MIQSLLQAAVKNVSRQDHIKVVGHWTSKKETFEMLCFLTNKFSETKHSDISNIQY